MYWKAVYLCIGLGEDYNVKSTLFYAYRYRSLTMIMVVRVVGCNCYIILHIYPLTIDNTHLIV